MIARRAARDSVLRHPIIQRVLRHAELRRDLRLARALPHDAGVAALLMMKKKSHGDDEEGAAEEKPAATAHAKPGTPPTFVPLDPFTVNLADKDVDRFAQIGVTLQVEDPKFADQIKAYMPAIRSNVLMVLSHKMAGDLLTREGKEKLAKEIMPLPNEREMDVLLATGEHKIVFPFGNTFFLRVKPGEKVWVPFGTQIFRRG